MIGWGVWFLSAVVLACGTALGTDSPQTTVIIGATLIDGTGAAPVPDSVIIVRGNKLRTIGPRSVLRIPRHSHIIDAHSQYVIPGLIDCHCHLDDPGVGDLADSFNQWSTPQELRELILDNARLDLAGGVTTVRDPGSTSLLFRVRQEIGTGSAPGPRILASGPQLVKKTAGAQADPSFLEYDGPSEARARVRELVALGADFIKIRLTSQRTVPSLEEVRAIAEEAHRLGRRATVHTDVPADTLVQLAIDAGADGIEHNAPLRGPDTLLQQMAAKHMYVVPGIGTIWVQRIEDHDPAIMIGPNARKVLLPRILKVLEKAVAAQAEQNRQNRDYFQLSNLLPRASSGMQRARQAGVLIGFGTDCGGDLILHGQQWQALYGESVFGSTPMQVLQMATRDAARILGRETELGTLEPGKLADLVILDGDPLADARNFARVHAVMKDGKLYRPEALIPH